MKGTGVAAVRERIRQSFLSIHNDQRDREQRQADEEMLAAVQPKPEEETVEVVGAAETTRLSVEERANLYMRAALHVPHIRKHTPRRTNAHSAYVIEEVKQDWQTLCDEALKTQYTPR